MSRLNRRQNVLVARRQEKKKWMALDIIQQRRGQDGLAPHNLRDPAVDRAVTQVVAEIEPQLAGGALAIDEQVQRMVPHVQRAIEQLVGPAGGAAVVDEDPAAAFARLMGGVAEETQAMAMPYNATAGEGDPYAALIQYQARQADEREAKLKVEQQKRKAEQAAFLQEQIALRKKIAADERAKQIQMELQEQENRNKWQRQEALKMQLAEQKRRAEYAQILEYQEQRQKKNAAEKARVMAQDKQYLRQIEQAQLAAEERDRQRQIQWKEEAKKTKEANDARLGLRAAAARREIEEDKARNRIFEERQAATEAQRIADLESIKRRQEDLTNLGVKAANEQYEREQEIERQIQKAIRQDEEKVRLRDEEKARAKAAFLEEQRRWKASEDARKAEASARQKAEEMQEVLMFKQQLLQAEAMDATKAQDRRAAAAAVHSTLKQQMVERQQRNRKARVEMSAQEFAMNAQVLGSFSPAKPSARSTMGRAGRSIIF